MARVTSHAGELLVDLFEGGHDLFLADRMRGQLELPFHVGAGELQALGRAMLLGVVHFRTAPLAIVLARIHLLLQPGLGIDESLTSITHTVPVSAFLPKALCVPRAPI